MNQGCIMKAKYGNKIHFHTPVHSIATKIA